MFFFGTPALLSHYADLRYLCYRESPFEKTNKQTNNITRSHSHPHALAKTPGANLLERSLISPSILAFIIQSYGSVLSPFSVNSDVSHGSSRGRGNGSGAQEEREGGRKASTDSARLSSASSFPRSVLTGSGTSSDERGNLSRAMASVVGSACLRTEGGVGPQLTSHVFGLLKARTGEDQGYEMNEEDRWLASDEGTEWVIKTVDSILDVVAPEPSGQQVKAKL